MGIFYLTEIKSGVVLTSDLIKDGIDAMKLLTLSKQN